MQRTVCSYCDKRQVDICSLCAGQLFLAFFCDFPSVSGRHLLSALRSPRFSFCKAVSQEVHHCIVGVIAAQVCVTVCEPVLRTRRRPVPEWKRRMYRPCGRIPESCGSLLLCQDRMPKIATVGSLMILFTSRPAILPASRLPASVRRRSMQEL